MTAKEKASVVSQAKKLGLSAGEYLRRAAESFNPNDDTKALEFMVNKIAERAERAIEDAMTFVEVSNRRLALMSTKGKTD